MIKNINYKDLPTNIAKEKLICARHSGNVKEAAIVGQHIYISMPECMNRTSS